MDAIAAIRSFNRFYAGRIGALEEHFLGQARPLGEARLLFEIGEAGASISELRARLALDSGYLSRLLRRLEEDGLVATEPDPNDGRRRFAVLTHRGVEEWDTLDRLSNHQIEAIVKPLGERRSAELADALSRAHHLVAAASITLEVVDAREPDAQAAMSAYFAELDTLFPTGFDPGDALTADVHAYDPPTGAFVVAYTNDRRAAGCGALLTMESSVGEIKRMWVAPEWRGVGLAGRILEDLESRSRSAGHSRTVLDTNAALHDAIAMYERAGYRPIERYNDNPYAQRWFEKRW
ncbi:MAG: helix-turn-helix domain-containing GNAT family N-acetyltransferase [Actinomycetota bacterium]